MDKSTIILVAFFVGVISFIFGLVVDRIKRKRNKVVGILKIVQDDEQDKPYMFLQISNPELLELSEKKYVFLRVECLRCSNRSDGTRG